MHQFNLLWGLNETHEIMTVPYFRAMYALSLMRGPHINDWVNNQVTILRESSTCQQNPIPRNDEQHWNDLKTAFENAYTDTANVMIHPHFSLPPRLSPIRQQYQHLHHRQHQHLHHRQHQHQHPSMSITQQHQLPVTPPPLTPDIICHNPWRTNEQSRSSQRRNQALGLFFHSWTPRPCNDPLCRAPHQQPRPLQTTSPSLCSPTTSHLLSMPSSGSLGI